MTERRTSVARRSTGSVSIDDVAHRAAVSTATVSRALRGLPGVSVGTRERVERAAAELDYSVSPIAAGLASGKVRTVAVVTPFVGRWFFGEMLMAAADVLAHDGYEIALYVIDEPESRRRFFADLPPRGRAGAVLMIGMPISGAEHDRLRSLEVPLLVAGHVPVGIPAVGIDDREAARMAVRHLIGLGHRKIAMVCGDREQEEFLVPQQRGAGYAAAMAEAGLPVEKHWIAHGGFTAAGGERAVHEVLDAPGTPPTAVFCQSDEMAFGALRALADRGLRCPQDVSVVGIDDHELARLWDLTTVAQPVPDQGRRAAQMILHAIAGGEHPEGESAVRLPVWLRVRGSTAPQQRAKDALSHEKR